jgi:gamma-glutamyl:cysteine ligase YbdK (ATP-grasp superfamily)
MTPPNPLHLFEGYGVELEYMIVDAETLSVLPIADQLLRNDAGEFVNEVEHGALCWSNELSLHVIELKVNGPVASLDGLHRTFQEHVAEINARLEPLGGRLMPTAMHPWMDPHTETRLWPHDHNAIYEAFDRVFGCRGHGWSNLQSVHLNLPFADEDEFARLHAAIRLLMPIMPALAASSPIVELHVNGVLDNRMEVYRTNCARIPSVTGLVIPEPVFTPEAYRRDVLERMYRDIAPFDPEGTLQDEWLNARGAIARFERNTIEIRVLDVQECPQADLAIIWAVVGVLKALCDERVAPLRDQQAWPVEPLYAVFLDVVRDAESAVITDRAYLESLGLNIPSATAGELWQHLIETYVAAKAPGARRAPEYLEPLRHITQHGTLARRILRALNEDTSQAHVAALYRTLCNCLAEGEMLQRLCG